MLEKEGSNATQINLDKDVYVDTKYSLVVNVSDDNTSIDSKYTSFKKIEYIVYNHNNVELDVKGNYKVSMSVRSEDVNKYRFTLFELTNTGEYKEIEYTYKNGKIEFNIDSTSKVIFATRDIEYHFIYLFSGVLFFSLLFIIVYRVKHSRMKEEVMY